MRMVMLWQGSEASSCVVRLTQTQEIGAMVSVFEDIAAEQGWNHSGALGRWQERSIYFALLCAEATPQFQGGLQLLFPEASGMLPCHTLWPDAPLLPRRVSGQPRCAHIAMLGLLAERRGHPLHFWQLCIEMWRYCVTHNLTTLFIEVTPRVLPLYRHLGWPLSICGELRLHWGEECYLCTMELPAVAHALLSRAQNSSHYHQIIAQALRLS